MNYLTNLGISIDEINSLRNNLKKSTLEAVELFPRIIEANYEILKNVGIANYKEIFLNHTHMFLQNPNRFQAIFDKYDHADLIRCLEKNGAIIEKL